MGISKTDSFNENQNRIAQMAKALAHPARVAIIEHLLKVNQCICGDIVNELPLAQSTVSQHLKALKDAGLIKGSIEGKAICYCIDEITFQELSSFFDLITKNLSEKSQCC